MKELLGKVLAGDRRALARAITIVENGLPGSEELLEQIPSRTDVPLTGFTGPPGAGKSTLISAFSSYLVQKKQKVAILAVDPSSPFTHGALMGDRLRMAEHFLHPDVFIRSLATRGSLGGLTPRLFEVADLVRAAGFDHVIIETVGVGQSEVEIAALADTTVLVLVPEAGDEIQAIKSGIMEIADVFVVNKADREGADGFYKNLVMLAHSHAKNGLQTPVLKTIALKNDGIDALEQAVLAHHSNNPNKAKLLAAKALMLIRDMRTRDIDTATLEQAIRVAMQQQYFNLHRFAKSYSQQTKG
jgi:LAO/AO transport system kinase